MEHDGNGWTTCGLGHRHWGLFGGAGLLLVDRRGVAEPVVLLMHRATWTANGGTWGLPGGARDSHESAVEAALRESYEEARLPSSAVRVTGELVDDHGGWSYTTVGGDLLADVAVVIDEESSELAWVGVGTVAAYDLHPGLAATWPALRASI